MKKGDQGDVDVFRGCVPLKSNLAFDSFDKDVDIEDVGCNDDPRVDLNDALGQLQLVASLWDPSLWLAARDGIVQRRRTSGMAALFECVRATTERALKKNAYDLPVDQLRSGHVNLGQHIDSHRSCRWFGGCNVETPEALADFELRNKKVTPPLIFTEVSGVDVVARLRKIHGKDRQIILAAEVVDFDSAGKAQFWRQKGISPTCLPLRSDFSLHVEEAVAELRVNYSTGTMQEHLSAQSDPYVFLNSGVTVFRGAKEDGFPFIEDPFQVHVIGASMAAGRPPVQTINNEAGATSWYAIKNDHTSLHDRYSLIGLVALEAGGRQVRMPGSQREAELPILVITAMSGTGCHPRDALASILKNWRRRFAPFFRSVYVSFSEQKGSGLASYVDDVVNKTTYKMVVTDNFSVEMAASRAMPWHWDSQELKMSCARGHLEAVAKFCRKIPAARQRSSTRDTIVAKHRPAPTSDLNKTVDQDFSDPNLYRATTKKKTLAALQALDSAQGNLQWSCSKPEDAPPEQDESVESDIDDEPPDTQTNFGFIKGTLNRQDTQFEAERCGALVGRMSSGGALTRSQTLGLSACGSKETLQLSACASPEEGVSGIVTPCASGMATPCQNDQPSFDLGDLKDAMRKDCINNAKVIIGQRSGAATMASLYLAGGLKDMLGFERKVSKGRTKSKDRVVGESPGNLAKGNKSEKKSPKRKGKKINSDKSGVQSIEDELGEASQPTATKGKNKAAEHMKTGAVQEVKGDAEKDADSDDEWVPSHLKPHHLSNAAALDLDIFADGNLSGPPTVPTPISTRRSSCPGVNDRQEDMRAKIRDELLNRHAPVAPVAPKTGHSRPSIDSTGSAIVSSISGLQREDDDLATRFKKMRSAKFGSCPH